MMGWTPLPFRRDTEVTGDSWAWGSVIYQEESDMNATTVAVDVAKSVFQLAVANDDWHITESHRLTRMQFERWFANRDVRLVIMEACGSAHHWARYLNALGIEVRLLPAAYVRKYVLRNKTDAADARALLEAARASDIQPVKIKSMEQQALQALHRTRSLWMSTRTSRINALRGFCREFGLAVPVGARTGVEAMSRTGRSALGDTDANSSLDAVAHRGDSLAGGAHRAAGARVVGVGQAQFGLHAAHEYSGHRSAHGHRDGGRYHWQCESLQECTALCQLVRADATRVQFR